MSKSIKYILLFSVLFIVIGPVFSQGVYRQFGIGFRTGFWKYSDRGPDRYQAGTVQSDVGGGMVYFFARLVDRWYLEASLGGVQRSVISYTGVENVTMTPLLLGARYDLLSSKLGSIFQPYVAFGGGIYTMQRNLVSGGVYYENNAELGGFVGAGVNVVITSWFAFNSDIKYHKINRTSSYTSELSGLQLGFGLSFMFGSLPEILRIEDINVIVEDIYPAYYEFYSTYPIAQVSVRNMADYSIEVNLRSNIEGYSERSQESGFIKIEPGEITKIPVYALFGPKLLYTSKREPAVIDMSLEARTGASQVESMSVNVIIHSRNAWNGEIDRLRFFLTPDDEEIMSISRDALEKLPVNAQAQTKNFTIARYIFEMIENTGVSYRSDPNIPYYKDDYVQFALETLEKKSGDCDDLFVLYSSLLESIGIQTAIIEVKDPNKDIAHLYMMFNTGISSENGYLISSNDKRYIIRENKSGKKSIWIPVETTLIQEGFDKAWETGATNYLKEGILRNGIAEGWVRIITVE